MSRRFILASALMLAPMGLGGCLPLAANQGFQVVDVAPSDIQVGVDTKATVTSKLGTATTKSTLSDDTWYYVTQVSSSLAFYKPRVTTRNVVAIVFAPDQKVSAVNKYGIEAGKLFAYNGGATPTRGRELSVLEQLLGNLGNTAPFLDDVAAGTPGTRPGDR